WRDDGGRRYGGFYTQAQIRDIVAYAAARFVTIVPEIDMPAHANAALASYPEIGCTPGPFAVLRVGQFTNNVLNPAKPSTYAFVDGVLTEVMALFPSTAIHIGGDECPKAEWKASPECQALMRREGLKDEDALQNYFTRRIAAFLAAHGRRLQGWNEILKGGPLPKDVIVQQWSDPQAAVTAARAGNDVVSSLTRYAYFDYGYNVTSLKRVYSYDPMPPGLTSVQARHILGAEACLWTESKPTDAVANEYIWPRLTALAEVAWSPQAARDWAGFRARLLAAQYERMAQRGVDTRQALIERSDFDWGVRVGAWEPSQMSVEWKTLDWDVTSQVHGPGTYTLHLNYEGGADALVMASAELLRDGQSVAHDVHDGRTGAVTSGRVYHLSLGTYDPAAHYAIRVRLRSDGGTDSHGAVWLAGPEGAEHG
ncbi:MAG: family 20 glycosylhydrolase, partial [Armatimonadota bacterium]|nr:family 20 glycosylhydrolase [Armatimonadota bacterium]